MVDNPEEIEFDNPEGIEYKYPPMKSGVTPLSQETTPKGLNTIAAEYFHFTDTAQMTIC